MHEPLKTYWNIGTTILTLLVGYLVFPLNAEVDKNSNAINDLKTRMAVQETMMIGMDEKLDDIKKTLDRILDEFHK
jgi:hypothetical protein